MNIYKNSANVEQINIKEEFEKYTKFKLLLNNKEISWIKSHVIGKLKGLSIIEYIEQIKIKDIDIEIMSQDIKYFILSKTGKKEIERK